MCPAPNEPTGNAGVSLPNSGPPPSLPGGYLVVELTNRCSLRCVHCSVSEAGHGHHLQTGYLDPDLFHKLMDDLVETGAHWDTLVLFWLGEPLIHPHFGDIWRAALRTAVRHHTFRKVEVHTNATHLTDRMVRTALNDADIPQVWHFSLDAVSIETYLRVKGKDRMDEVRTNVHGFLRHRANTGARWPRPVFQFIVGSNNVQEAATFRDHWLAACDALGTPARIAAGHVPPGHDPVVLFRQLDCPTAEAQERENTLFRTTMAKFGLELPAAAAHGKMVEPENLHPCSGFWKSPVISWRGELTTCTRDNLLENQIGNIRHSSFKALWWGTEMEGRRAKVAVGNYGAHPLCQTCFIPRSLNHTALSPEDIARTAQWATGSGT
jgi:hypothetical protein